MIGHPVLRKIVCTNFFFAPAGADLAAPLGTVFLSFLALLSLEQTGAQDRHRFLLVLELTPSVLATNDRSGWNVQNLDRRIGRIHALPTGAASARNLDAQIFRLQFKIDIFRLWQHRDSCSGGVNTALRFRRRNTLDPMHAAFVTQFSKNRFAGNAKNYFF